MGREGEERGRSTHHGLVVDLSLCLHVPALHDVHKLREETAR